MSKEKTFAKVDEALSEGALWRAKEILQGNIANGYDLDIYEKYGQVLLQMGDLLEAGKYLFLCGREDSSYKQSTALFLKRFSKADSRILIFTFPKSAQLSKIESYPQTVQKYLLDNGYTNKSLPQPKTFEPDSLMTRIKIKLVGIAFLMLLIVFIIGFLSALCHGFETIFSWFE